MAQFYSFSSATRIFVSFILGISVLTQALAFLFKYYRGSQKLNRFFDSLLELFILGEILVFALLHGQVINGYVIGLVVPSGYDQIRIFTFIIILILVLVVCFFNKSLLPLTVILATVILLPIIERTIGSAFPWFFIMALIFFLVRSIISARSSLLTLQTSISVLSVKNAVDTLHTGVLFSDIKGTMILLNYQMQKLMTEITGKVFRNAIDFYEALLSDKYEDRYRKAELGGQVVYLLKDGSAWIFTRTFILFKRESYTHLSFSDVTELWSLTEKLQQQYQALKYKSQELKETIANIHDIIEEREVENAKMRAHDILGQRLTVLLRIIQNGEELDYELLTELSQGLLDDLKSESNDKKPEDELRNIQDIFAAIGVNVVIEGQLPIDIEKASLVVNIVREASTNAVRHGFATIINVKLDIIENEYRVVISNNGHTDKVPIILGGGIGLMKKKILEQGGSLEIIQVPLFSLSISLSGGESNV